MGDLWESETASHSGATQEEIEFILKFGSNDPAIEFLLHGERNVCLREWKQGNSGWPESAGGILNMVEKNETLHAIELLKAIEWTVSRIYEVFANKFPVHKDLWTQLSDEEKLHARWIENLLVEAASGSIKLKKGRFNAGAIQSFSQYAEEILCRIKKENISLTQAVDMAIDLETSLLERRFYEIFDGDSDILRETFSNMIAETSDHIGKIRTIVSLSKS